MKTMDNVGIIFVNAVVGRGSLNGVVNLQLGALPFEPTEDNKVSGELVTACRLRMDATCARQIRDSLSELLDVMDRREAEAASGVAGVAVRSDSQNEQVGEKKLN